jgi:hypothetical protein
VLNEAFAVEAQQAQDILDVLAAEEELTGLTGLLERLLEAELASDAGGGI